MSTLIVKKQTAASGKGLKPGEYNVPGDVSEQDARLLVGLHRAEWKEPAQRIETAEVVPEETAVVPGPKRSRKPRARKSEET
jgi:hypothetical protein